MKTLKERWALSTWLLTISFPSGRCCFPFEELSWPVFWLANSCAQGDSSFPPGARCLAFDAGSRLGLAFDALKRHSPLNLSPGCSWTALPHVCSWKTSSEYLRMAQLGDLPWVKVFILEHIPSMFLRTLLPLCSHFSPGGHLFWD